MLLHNQTKDRRVWDGGGKRFEWEPFGSCEVPDEIVPFLKKQRFPVGPVAVPPETKARAVVDAELAAAASDRETRLRRELEQANAKAAVAAEAVERAELAKTEAQAESLRLGNRVRELETELARSRADVKAAEEMLTEQTRKLEASEHKSAMAGAKEKVAQKQPGK